MLRGSGATPPEDGDPRRIGPVHVLGRLGAGGMGRVYLGVHEGRYVAVKQILPRHADDPGFHRRFGRELDHLARLPDGATCALVAGDRAADAPWFATAYVPGITLADARTLCGGTLPVPCLWRLLREIARALTEVHALDLVHRDIKPSNIMLTSRGVTLIDFGVSRAADQTRMTMQPIGTPAYMAPEQSDGGAGTPATDVYALGATLASAALGSPLPRPEPGATMPDRLAAVDPELSELIWSCLSRIPADRPPLAALVEAAGTSAAPDWPEPVREAVAERELFASRPVLVVDVPEKEPADAPPDPPQNPPKPRSRRRKLMPVIIPVLIGTGATLAVSLLPYVMPADDADPKIADPVTSTTAPAPTATPTKKKSPKPSPSRTPARDDAAKPSPSKTPAPSPTRTNSAPQPPDVSAGTLRNAASGECMTVTYGGMIAIGACSANSTQWSFHKVTGGHQIVARPSGDCISYYGPVQMSTCREDGADGFGSDVWVRGNDGTLKSTVSGGCLDGSSAMASVATCNGSPDQRWL
ncbi:Serine/threonine-protein kinase PknD [Streptomyces sp. RB5]|uniref:Serine/threonine-protein kinase PknD n=1 Tax=Streptomyces smaragdinus TaxID=2585196 RepID=A0A7K0CJ52_9ACTN|nr:serine/threonine protein kinase [Streptomyces smaragdinus]MQY13488.1 Serine/threonine-protein kinase PknD [Streptomyces smaragdinus]